ncbi:MAG: amino acid permease [Myxococcales bacterium]
MGIGTATAVVIANMIGAGIFTTTGFQAAALGSPLYIYALWLLGGLLALCGALCYGELGAAMPEAGGEYVYLREAYGPVFGLMSAVVSLTAGFSAPIAAALLSLMKYLSHYVGWLSDKPVLLHLSSGELCAIALVWTLVGMHAVRVSLGLSVTNVLTAFKVGAIVVFILAAVLFGEGDTANLVATSAAMPSASGLPGAMASSLIFVMFCYSGWNSASYLAGELHEPQRVLPRALLFGTALVIALYLGLNLVYFYGVGVDGLAGKVEVALVAAEQLFGGLGAGLVTAALSVSLLAAASVMTAVGPRVYYAAGRDSALLGRLSTVADDGGAPRSALILQGAVTSAIVALGTVDQIQQYAGFTLSLFATLAVAAVIVLRRRAPGRALPFRAWGYPITPLLFIAVSLWMMFWAATARPVESALGLATVAVCGALGQWLVR